MIFKYSKAVELDDLQDWSIYKFQHVNKQVSSCPTSSPLEMCEGCPKQDGFTVTDRAGNRAWKGLEMQEAALFLDMYCPVQ